MDLFATVVTIVFAGIALFVGYKVGIKDGFRGGMHTGRQIERRAAEEERRYLAARLVNVQAELAAHAPQRALPPFPRQAGTALEPAWQEPHAAQPFEALEEYRMPVQEPWRETERGS